MELDPDTLTPIGEKQELIFGNETTLGYERPGNNGIVDREASVLYQSMKQFYDPKTGKLNLPPQMANIPRPECRKPDCHVQRHRQALH